MKKITLQPIPFDEELARFIAQKFVLSASWVKKVRRIGFIPRKYFIDTLLPIPDSWVKAQNAVLDMLYEQPGISTNALSKLYASYPRKLAEMIHYRQMELAGGTARQQSVTRLFRNELIDITARLARLCQDLEYLLHQILQVLAGPLSANVQTYIQKIGNDPVILLAGPDPGRNGCLFLPKEETNGGQSRENPIDNPDTVAKFQPAIHNLWSALSDLPKLPEIT